VFFAFGSPSTSLGNRGALSLFVFRFALKERKTKTDIIRSTMLPFVLSLSKGKLELLSAMP
jgi:hypothetical protein